MTAPRTIALLGTGIMGSHMARRLAQAGVATTVWNRDRAKAEKLTQYGVSIAGTPSAACEQADVVIVMLSNGPVVEEVLFTPDASGLAGWSRADFAHAVREGRRPDGRQLDAFMPWRAFAELDDVELDALWAYMHGLAPRPYGQR